jgi:hypothetical protein
MDNNAANSLYDLLVTRNLEPELLDSAGKSVIDPSMADMFSFNWKTDSHDYGTVVILIDDHSNMEVYFGDNIGRTMEGDDKSEWYQFLEQLKTFATRNLLTFQLNNINRLKYTMQGISAIKEGLFEGYYGKKRISYSDQPRQTRLMIKHNRDLGEGEARYRAIESLFVETAEGERFKLPFRNLLGGRIMARHVSEGGTPYDTFGQHIAEIIEEMGTLGRFIRVARSKNFSGDTSSLVEAAVRHYSDLKAKAKRMIGQRGYHMERESYDPSELTDSNVAADAIRDMFIEQSIDHRIEEALPILAKLAPNTKEDSMKEADEFESWTNKVMEGTWALPDTPESEAKLKELMSRPLEVGPDATNATEQLYDLVGDDQLFDRLNELAEEDASANIWEDEAVINRLGELGIDITPTAGNDSNNQDVTEDYDSSPVASAITRRILLQRTDLLSKYGPEKVTAAIDEVADFVGDVEEIGSSDVSGWIRHVEQMLGNMGDQDVAEGLDPEKRSRLDALIGMYRDSTDPEDYYDSEYEDPEQVLDMIRAEFGDKVAGQIEAGTDKMHFPRQDHAQGYDTMSWKKPVDRVTKAGKMYKQDIDSRKNSIKSKFDIAETQLDDLRRRAGIIKNEDLDTDGVMMTTPSNMSS